MKVNIVSCTKWDDFNFNFVPDVFLYHDKTVDKESTCLAFGWLCWSIELIW